MNLIASKRTFTLNMHATVECRVHLIAQAGYTFLYSTAMYTVYARYVGHPPHNSAIAAFNNYICMGKHAYPPFVTLKLSTLFIRGNVNVCLTFAQSTLQSRWRSVVNLSTTTKNDGVMTT